MAFIIPYNNRNHQFSFDDDGVVTYHGWDHYDMDNDVEN